MNRNHLPELVRTLHALGTFGDRLDPATATDEQLAIVARAIEEARRLVAAAKGPANRCPRHPGAPGDPTEGGRCLFCARRPNAATRTDTPTADVLAAIQAHGEEEAARRHGARAVTLALAVAGRGSHLNPTTIRRRTQELTP
ncbi:hypothetical protein [Streptomyces sp. NBC_01233]|uniref:hypothetical protein n=1 Tax=Streptomyces sp. NBC_01233 TaxID=2903787 RepID=UPI002E0D6333|nr:hypothetical protein OG332_24280 [Streptomyces sp. NBC_01233]